MSDSVRILVVDDDAGIREMLCTALRTEGYEVWQAVTAHAALQTARQQRPELVLVDVQLPDLNGMEVCRQIKSDPLLLDVVVVLISGPAETPPHKVEGLAAGADDYLSKPIHLGELFARVRTLLRLRHVTTSLRASEQHYRQLLGVLPDAFGLVDPQGRLLAVNSQAAAMLGYTHREELVGRSVFDFAPPLNHLQIKADLARTLESGLVHHGEYRLLKKCGGSLEVEVSAAVMQDAHGRSEGVVCVVRDVSGRKQAEEMLRASQERYRELAESSPDAIFILDREAKLRYVNQTAARWYNVAGTDMLGRAQEELFPAKIARRHKETVRRIFESGEAVQQERWISYLGHRRWTETRLLPLRDQEGQVTAVMGISRDLTDRRKLEEEAKRLTNAMQSTGELICITDVGNRFTFANQSFLATYGYSLAEVVGRTPDFLYSAKNPPGLCERIHHETLLGGWQGEVLNCRKDGTEFPISLNTARIQNQEGKTLGLVGVARDITEQKQAARQRDAFEQLGKRLNSAIDADDAARVILDIASGLFGWDAGYVHMYSAKDDQILPILTLDTLNGQRQIVQISKLERVPSPLMRSILAEGARLTNRNPDTATAVDYHPFGDIHRCSECMMHVPIYSRGKPIGVLSIQSYSPNAYSKADLRLLQTLANHCSEAFLRVEVTHALRDAEAKYRSIFENAVEGIYQSTPEGRYLSVNPALARILGYESPAEVIASITDIARQVFVNPARREEFKRSVERQGSVERFESKHRRKDGSQFWMSVNARVVRDSNGRVLFYEGTAVDTTELKWAEQVRQFQRDFGIFLSSANELKAVTEQLLVLALRHPGIDCSAVYLVDATATVLELVAHRGFSARFAERARRRPAQISRAPSHQPDTTMVDLVEQLQHEGLRARELLPLQHKGRVVAVLCLGSHRIESIPVESLHAMDTLASMAGGAIARIRAEQSLEASQRLIEKTLQSLRSAVLILKTEPVAIVYCNPAATQMFGYPRDELIGRSPDFLLRDEAGAEHFRAHLRQTVLETGALSDFEYPVKHKDGTVFPAEHNVVPIKDRTGRVVNWVATIRDLTVAKQTEDELRSVSRRIIEAQETERSRVARELHDGVNQVIASARMRLRSVETGVAAQFPAAREILARCGRLLVQALEENRRIAHNLRPTDLDQLGLVAASRNFCKEFQARTGLAVKCWIGRDLERLPPAMELNLFRILQEALTNVEKHARAKSAHLRLVLQDGAIVMRIQDDGRGFNPRRLKVARSRRGRVGLANLRERAALLEGTCDVESKPGHGTIITIRVPGPERDESASPGGSLI
ncbi:MAG: PAS domain S-box protein [Verrucomicrobiae bacterium]|nr:PAS domain S-box protein [Verrucomicrobiae bacterium]